MPQFRSTGRPKEEAYVVDDKELCAVSYSCEGICRELHRDQYGSRCPAWYTDEMIPGRKKKKTKRRRHS